MPRLRPAVVLEGGLGNQLFQFAYGLTLDHRPVIVDNRRRIMWGEPLKLVLRDQTWRTITQRELLAALQCPRVPKGQRTATRLWSEVMPGLSKAALRKAETERAGSDLTHAHGVTLVEGYYQDEAFVRSVEAEFLAALRPSLLQRHAAFVSHGSHVAISFRLAEDYESLGLVLPTTYYQRALDALLVGLSHPVLHVCSDSSSRALSLLTHLRVPATIVDHSGESPIDQLRVLASASRVAISNSTFAWWGAWLGDSVHHDERPVFAPARWLAASDDVPALRWHRIPVD